MSHWLAVLEIDRGHGSARAFLWRIAEARALRVRLTKHGRYDEHRLLLGRRADRLGHSCSTGCARSGQFIRIPYAIVGCAS